MVAVGEMQLDWCLNVPKQTQLDLVAEQLLLAKEASLPALLRVHGPASAWAVALGLLRQPEFRSVRISLSEDLHAPADAEAAIVRDCPLVFFEVTPQCARSPRAAARALRLPWSRLLLASGAVAGGSGPRAVCEVPASLAQVSALSTERWAELFVANAGLFFVPLPV